MDQIKIGSFIAALRKRDGLTQEQLGEKLGVTNKTVSRWENGNYMPDIETFLLLSEIFHVSINELLAGEMLNDQDFREKADEAIVAVARESVFTTREQLDFWKAKYTKEHRWLYFMIAVLFIGLCIFFTFSHRHGRNSLGLYGLVILAQFLIGYLNEKKMTYAENKVFGGNKTKNSKPAE